MTGRCDACGQNAVEVVRLAPSELPPPRRNGTPRLVLPPSAAALGATLCRSCIRHGWSAVTGRSQRAMAVALTGASFRWLTELHPNPLNPRGAVGHEGIEELAASIAAQGVLQPLLVTPDGTIVAGHRRHLAALRAGLTGVPVIVRAMTEAEQLEAMLVENLQREDLTPVQEARAYERMLAGGRDVAALSRRLGVARDRIARRLELLELAPEVQAMFDRYEVPITLARPLVRVRDWPTQKRLVVFAARRALKVAVLERLVERSLGGAAPIARKPRPSPGEDDAPPNVRAVRADLLTALEADPERTISFRRLAQAAGDVCCACGMQDERDICAACPLPAMLAEVVS